MRTSKFIQYARQNAPTVYVGFVKLRVPKLRERLTHLRYLYKNATLTEKERIKLEALDIKKELQMYTRPEGTAGGR